MSEILHTSLMNQVLHLDTDDQKAFLRELITIYVAEELIPFIDDSEDQHRIWLIRYLLCNDQIMRNNLIETANSQVLSIIKSIHALANQTALFKVHTTEYIEQENDAKILDELESAFK